MKRRILIVDDIEFVRKTLVKILTDAHYEVVGEAKDGTEAIEKYFLLRPDLVTMDVVMPNTSGIEATRIITRKDPHAKILIISAMAQENLIMEAISAGAKDYLTKPFKTEDVLRTLEHVFTAEDKIAERAKRMDSSEGS